MISGNGRRFPCPARCSWDRPHRRLPSHRLPPARPPRVFVSTEDGSAGFKGVVTDLLLELVVNFGRLSNCAVYGCGPEAMYKSLSSVCREYRLPAQVLLERRTVCGIGACLACICKIDKERALIVGDVHRSHMQFLAEEDFGYALVCKDGPVFDLEEVILDA